MAIGIYTFAMKSRKCTRLEFRDIVVKKNRNYYIRIHKKGRGETAQHSEGKISIGDIVRHTVWALEGEWSIGEERVVSNSRLYGLNVIY
jgi:hypothetical protein